MGTKATGRFKRAYQKNMRFYDHKTGKVEDHVILYVEFDFDDPVPCNVYRVKDTFALYGEYVDEFINRAKEGDEYVVKFGSERGKHGGRIVSATRKA